MALKTAKGNYEKSMTLSDSAIVDIEWWIKNVKSSFKHIYCSIYWCYSCTDASKTGWGAVLDDRKTFGAWNEVEKEQHKLSGTGSSLFWIKVTL